MDNNLEYKEGSHSDFIEYLFSNEPKDKDSIQLESPHLDPNKNMGLHIFEQLLMIYVDGLKYFFGENQKVNINKLSQEDIEKVNQYFISMNYEVNLEVFATMNEYQFKFPNYFKDQQHIQSDTTLNDFYYEIYSENNKVFRISFRNM